MEQLTTFRLGSHWCGIPLEMVQEAVVAGEVTPVPLSPPEIVGLINLRGRIITVVDLAPVLRLETSGPGGARMQVVLDGKWRDVSLLVDRMDDVITVEEESLEPPPETLDEGIRNLITGAFERPGGIVLSLDLERVLASVLGRER